MRTIFLLCLSITLAGAASASPSDATPTPRAGTHHAKATEVASQVLDLQRMRRRLARSAALDFQQKLKLRTQVNALIRDAKKIRASDLSGWRGLRQRYDRLLDRVIELARSDEGLRNALLSAREFLWQEMVLHSRGNRLG